MMHMYREILVSRRAACLVHPCKASREQHSASQHAHANVHVPEHAASAMTGTPPLAHAC